MDTEAEVIECLALRYNIGDIDEDQRSLCMRWGEVCARPLADVVEKKSPDMHYA